MLRGSRAYMDVIENPELLLALGAVLLAVRTGWFPSGGMRSIAAA